MRTIKKLLEIVPTKYPLSLRIGIVLKPFRKTSDTLLTVGTHVRVVGFSFMITLALNYKFAVGTSAVSIGTCFVLSALKYKLWLKISAVAYELNIASKNGINKFTAWVVSNMITVKEYVSLQYPESIADAPNTAFYYASSLLM